MMLNVTRTVHNIGQGGFHTEKITYNGTTHTIVYDCGSTTSAGRLKKKIKEFFPCNNDTQKKKVLAVLII